MSQLVQDLRDAYNVRDLADWELLSDAADEIERLRATLTIIAGSTDRLQATQALGALDNIGAKVS
jgi:hypothetical protein